MGRLQRLAVVALEEYDLSALGITPLQYWQTATFRVDAGAERFVLRMAPARSGSADALASQLAWVEALARTGGCRVSAAVPTRDGGLFQTCTATGLAGDWHCVLTRWIEGESRSALAVPGLRQIGRLLADLHAFSASWTPPSGFVRPRWDLPGLLGGAFGLNPESSMAVLSPRERTTVRRCAERVGHAMQRLGEAPDVWGMIHADIHEGSCLFHECAVGVIHFDLCGWGYYIYDIAVMLSALPESAQADGRRAVLEGYREARPLPPEHEACLDVFVAGRVMWRALWTAGMLDLAPFRKRGRFVVTREIARLEKLLKEIPCRTRHVGES